MLLALLCAFAGCAKPKPVVSLGIPNRVLGSASVAVAPAVNLSGSTDFDPNRFADLMAVELAYAEGISVIPVSRVLGVLAAQGKERIESPAHAAEILEWLGADALLVFAVTEYVPYDPPRIGISAQVFVGGSDPKPQAQTADESGLDAGAVRAKPVNPRVIAECQQVFDAAHGATVAAIQAYAAGRSADGSPYGWRRYVVSQEGYIQFCSHATALKLLGGKPMTTPQVAQGQ